MLKKLKYMLYLKLFLPQAAGHFVFQSNCFLKLIINLHSFEVFTSILQTINLFHSNPHALKQVTLKAYIISVINQ